MSQDLTITAEQLAERDAWDMRHMTGKCTIDEALSMCMAIGAPVSPYLRSQYENAWNTYRAVKESNLAELLGHSLTTTDRNKVEKETRVSNVRFHVDSFHQAGFSKNNPSHYEGTAFHVVGKFLSKSPSQIFDIYHGK